MKKIDDSDFAKELLRQKADGFSLVRILRKAQHTYILFSAVLIVVVLGACMYPDNPMFWLLIGLCVGVVLRDYRWLRASRSQWPIAERFIDWDKVEQAAKENDRQPSTPPYSENRSGSPQG